MEYDCSALQRLIKVGTALLGQLLVDWDVLADRVDVQDKLREVPTVLFEVYMYMAGRRASIASRTP